MKYIKETYERAFIIMLTLACLLAALTGWIFILDLCVTYTWWFLFMFALYPLLIAILRRLDDMWR